MTIVNAALNYRGVRECTPEHKQLIDKYNALVASKYGCYKMTYSDPWCAAFVSLCAAEAGYKDFPFSAACNPMRDWAIKRNRWTKTPKSGDLVLFDWNGDGSLDHVGIVYNVAGNLFYSIEGNTSNMCEIRSYSFNNSCVAGFVSLDEGDENIMVYTTPEENKPIPKMPVPVVRYGNKSTWVLAMQALLISHGFGCGKDGADGEYGNATRHALILFQKAQGLEADAECGPKTWARLVGVGDD